MVIFGLLLLGLGILLGLAGAFTINYDRDENNPARDTTEILGINCSPEVIFLLGAICAALVLFGLWFMKTGAKQGWKHRKEQKKLTELSEKLERAEADRRRDDEDDPPS
jgi:hypothetical protein